jgi:arylsulfatase A-like enzyme
MLARRQFLSALAASAAVRAASPKPNILLILADDLGYSDLGCYGSEIKTPNLDRLAAGGLRFTQMYSTARCWPSRSCLMTGYYPQQIGRDAGNGYFPRWARYVPEYLHAEGYRCYHSGKWHVTGKLPVADAKFDHSYTVNDQDRFWSPKNHLLEDKPQPQPAPDGSYYASGVIGDYALRWLDEHQKDHKEKPFFLYLAFTAPHFPIQAPDSDIAPYRGAYDQGWDAVRASRHQRLKKLGISSSPLPPLEPDVTPNWNLSEAELKQRIGPGEVGRAVPWNSLTPEEKKFQAQKMEVHAGMITRIDSEIGRVLAQLDKMGVTRDTLIMFGSDNGASPEQIIRGDMHDPAAPVGSHKTFLGIGPGWASAANTPFRLHKHWNHEGGVSSPFVVHWPKGISSKGQLRKNPAHFVDVTATILDAAGAKPTMAHNGLTPPPFPGSSLTPAFTKDNTVRKDYIWFHHTVNRGLRAGNWKISWKGQQGPWELYDLSEDRGETRNLAAQMPAKLNELTDTWERLEAQFAADNAIGK